MIGTAFLVRLLLLVFYAVILLVILYVLIFGVTWMVRLFVDGVGTTLGDHATWLRSKMPTITFKKRKPRE